MTTSTMLSPTAATIPAGREVIGEYVDYADAQRTVDRLSDLKFPVDSVRIVGTGVRSVEDVTGRMTTGRAALIGAGTGAWIGVLVGFMVGLFAIATTLLGTLLMGLAVGAVWGAIFGALGHSATRGRRDFRSVRRLEAERYAVEVDAPLAREAALLVTG